MKITEFKFFYPEKPKLIHIDQPLFESLSNRKEYVAERKYNGSRLQLHYLDGEFQFWNRHGERMSYQPNEEISGAFDALSLNGYCLFDGELRNNKTKGVRHMIMFYDIFIWQDHLLVGRPFWHRRNLLKKIFKCNAEPVGITEQFPRNFRDVFNDVTQNPEIEGLVMKNTRGVLNLGRNSAVDSNWMYKCRKPNGSYRF